METKSARSGRAARALGPYLNASAYGLVIVGLMVVWAVHDGGYDTDTWYWGALVVLALTASALIGTGLGWWRLTRTSRMAVACFALYVLWSYLSITRAQYPGAALEGSNRALLYFLVFVLMSVLPWTARSAEAALVAFALGVGAIAVVLTFRFASQDHVASLFSGGRLAAPTGYFNSTAALFMMQALVSIGLAARRSLPGLVRGLLLALAAFALQLTVVVQSRGWLFTLPIVVILTVLVARDRLRFFAAAVVPVVATLIPVRALLRIYNSAPGAQLQHNAGHAGRIAIVVCGGAFVVGTLLAWGDQLARGRSLTRGRRLVIGTVLTLLTLGAASAGGLKVTHGHPIRFITRQWHGFSHQAVYANGSHFNDVGSGRYDFWRVSLDAFTAHPIGGLGQDNFSDYYISRRRTTEEPQWNHSLEMRLLSMTGVVGTVLFGGFLIAAVAAALRARRRGPFTAGQLAGVALLPVVVWLIHGSVDWFWEMPALSAPALGFLAMATALGSRTEPVEPEVAAARRWSRVVPRPLRVGAGTLALLAGVVVLGLPYLSVREVSVGGDIGIQDPAAALQHLKLASSFNPLDSDPGRFAGTIALQTSDFQAADQRFREATSREPGDWFSWLGAGLAASALGDATRAGRDFTHARSLNSVQPAIKAAVARVHSRHPLTAAEAFRMLVTVG